MKRALTMAAAMTGAAFLTACGGGDEAAEAEAPAETEMEAAAEPEAMDDPAEIEIDPDATPAERNLAMGEAFLAQNAERAEVVEAANGLQYEVLEAAADGAPSPDMGSWVCVHYTGSLTDGTVFDSSRERGMPIVLALNGLIEGWRQALPMMSEGDRWNIFLPSSLGYGPSGAGAVIPPNAVLVFDLELFRVLAVEDIAVTPEGRVDPNWDCSQRPPAEEDE